MAKFLLVNITIFGVLMGGSVSFPAENTQQRFTSQNPAYHAAVAIRDTIPIPPPSRSELAPGTAKIRAVVLRLNQTSGMSILAMEITEALGYGAATPPLATGREIMVDAGSYFKLHPKQADTLKAGTELTAVIRHRPTLDMEDAPPGWSLVKISN